MLAGPAYVEWADAQVLLQRHKSVLDPGCQSTGIFMNYFMFLTTGGGVSRLLGVQWRDDAPQALARPQ
jgi:hypothetical protein